MVGTLIGMGLFVLVIAVGFLVGLYLSPKGPQRKAVVISFALLAGIAVLFYVFAVTLSLPWAAPVFALLALVVPVATYSLIIRHAKAPVTVSRRNPNDPPRPIRNEDRVTGQRGPSARAGEGLSSSGRVIDDSLERNEAADNSSGVSRAKAIEPTVQAEQADTSGLEMEEIPTTPPVEALIDEYLIEENEIDDGLFEPEPSPTLYPHHNPDPVTESSVVVTVPHPEGNERFLVVSESTAPANPIMAYKRTTSSHLVHLGVTREGDAAADAPLIAAAIAAEQQAPVAADTRIRRPKHARIPDADMSGFVFGPDTPSPVAADVAGEKEAIPKETEETKEALPVYLSSEHPVAVSAHTSEDVTVERSRKETSVSTKPSPLSREVSPAVSSQEVTPESQAAKPVVAAADTGSASTSAAPSVTPVVQPQETPAKQAAPVWEETRSYVLIPESSFEPEPAVEPPVSPAPVSVSASMPVTAAAPAPNPASLLSPYELAIIRAEAMRDKGLLTVAARLYGEAAEVAVTTTENHRALFDEIACYVQAGLGDRARAKAAELRNTSVLTRVERIKLDAIERMG